MSKVAPVTLAISSYEEGSALARTIRSVLAADTTPAQVLILDDGSTDGSTHGPWPKCVTVLREQHVGIAAARNRGARHADQPILVFLDAHCEVDSDWLDPLCAALTSEPAAVVGPSICDSRRKNDAGCGALLVDPLWRYRWLVPGASPNPIPVGLLPGGCLAVLRENFLAAGGFAAFTGFGIEDVEFALRWWRLGNTALGVPSSRISHDFRKVAPYPAERLAWLQNVIRTSLTHLTGELLTESVMASARFPDFASAISTVLGEPWADRAREMAAREVRGTTSFLEEWAPHAFSTRQSNPVSKA